MEYCRTPYYWRPAHLGGILGLCRSKQDSCSGPSTEGDSLFWYFLHKCRGGETGGIGGYIPRSFWNWGCVQQISPAPFGDDLCMDVLIKDISGIYFGINLRKILSKKSRASASLRSVTWSTLACGVSLCWRRLVSNARVCPSVRSYFVRSFVRNALIDCITTGHILMNYSYGKNIHCRQCYNFCFTFLSIVPRFDTKTWKKPGYDRLLSSWVSSKFERRRA